jgi:hypothetical protein
VDDYGLDVTKPENAGMADTLVPEGILSAKFSSHTDELRVNQSLLHPGRTARY